MYLLLSSFYLARQKTNTREAYDNVGTDGFTSITNINILVITTKLTMTCACFSVSKICLLARACEGSNGVVAVGIDVTIM